jgi:hypothetical protein
MTLTERATGEWLDRELNGLRGDALLARLAELAPRVSMSVQRAAGIYRRFRYEQRFSARHFEVNRKYGVSESTYDPGVMAEMIDGAAQSEELPDNPGGQAEKLAETAAALLDYLQEGILKFQVRWKFWRWRKIRKGEKVELCEGAGERIVRGRPVSWMVCAVFVVQNGKTVAAFPEAKVRRYDKRRNGGKAMQIERMEIIGEDLNREELCRRFAAMLRLYRGGASGLRSQVHLAAAAGVTKQAVSDMQLRMKQHYHRRTGGRAQFAGVSGKGPQPKRTVSKRDDNNPPL